MQGVDETGRLVAGSAASTSAHSCRHRHASAAAKELDQYVSAEGKQTEQKLNNSLDGAIKSLYSYSIKVNDLGEQIVKAQKDANYWREKHYQDLKIIWFWRLLAFSAVICVIVYLGLKTSWKFFL